jgi:HD-like signal output (HDOD) protein
LGINFTLSIAFGSSIKNMINTDLASYGIGSDEFLEIANMSSNLLSLWISKVDYDLKEELILPVFLQETGKFIISDLVKDKGESEQFLAEVKNAKDISEVEKKFLSLTTSSVTASIFKKWNLNENLINSIEFVDELDKCPEKYKQNAQILHVVKTICNITDPFSDENVELGVAKAKQFGLAVSPLQKAIEKIQDRMLDA